MDQDQPITEHVRAAQDAFWSEIARRFPEIESGDLAPDADSAFDRACHDVVWTWLGSNVRTQ